MVLHDEPDEVGAVSMCTKHKTKIKRPHFIMEGCFQATGACVYYGYRYQKLVVSLIMAVTIIGVRFVFFVSPPIKIIC